MNPFGVSRIIALPFLLAAVCADPTEFVLTDQCDGTILVHDSAILTVNGWWMEDQQCRVTIKAVHAPYENQVRLELLQFRAACQSNSMILYAGDIDPSREIGDLCGDPFRDNRMYLTETDTLIIVLTSRSVPGPTFTARLLVTSESRWNGGSDFPCDDELNIDESLQCDGYNNCGDWSDESSDLCDRFHRSFKGIFVIAGLSVVYFFTVVIVIIVVVRRRRHYRKASLEPGVIKAPPSYGSIQGGSVNPAYTLPPPPPPPPQYSATDVTLPPSPRPQSLAGTTPTATTTPAPSSSEA